MNNSALRKYVILAAQIIGVFLVGCFFILLLFKTEAITNVWNRTQSILMPFIYGFVIAYLLRPTVVFLEKQFGKLQDKLVTKKRPGLVRFCSILITFVIVAIIIFLLFFAVIPQLISSISAIVSRLPRFVNQFQNWVLSLEQGATSHEAVLFLSRITDTLSAKLEQFLSTDLLPGMQSVVGQVTSSLFNLLTLLKNFGIGCIVAFYLLSGRERFLAQCHLILYSLFSEKWADRILNEVHYTDRMFGGFINGKLLDSAIIAAICFVFCSIAKMPYTLLISIIVGVTNMIPFFGPYIGAFPSTLLILMVNPTQALIFFIFIMILQQIDGNIIGPSILGDRVGISGFWVLFSIMIFGSVWGFIGMLIGVPVFAVLYDIVRKLVMLGLSKRKKEGLADEYHQKFPSK